MCVKCSVIYTIYSMFIVIYIKNYFKIRIGVVLNKIYTWYLNAKSFYLFIKWEKFITFYFSYNLKYVLNILKYVSMCKIQRSIF